MNKRSRLKRGIDHHWEVRRYKGDSALYAHCKCGFQYNCSSSRRVEDEDGTWSFKQYISIIYHYCPWCGVRKRWYNEEPVKMDRYSPIFE